MLWQTLFPESLKLTNISLELKKNLLRVQGIT